MNAWNELLANLAIVAISTALWTFGHGRVVRYLPRWKRLIFGFVMALGTLCAMMMPFHFSSGVNLDLRYTFLAISGLFGGPIAAFPPLIVAVSKRIVDGGTGLTVAFPQIAMATGSGLIAFKFAKDRVPSGWTIFVISTAVVFSGTVGFFVKVPLDQWNVVMPYVVLPFAALLFTSSTVAGLAISQEQKRYDATELNRIYRAIIEALPDCLNAKDVSGRFIAANPATASLMNAGAPENLIGNTDFDFYPPEAAQVFRADEERLLNGGTPVAVEQRVTRPDRVEIWLSTLKVPLKDVDGKIVGIITHNREITDRKLLERELAESEIRLSDAVASIADGLAMFDKRGVQIFNNARYIELFPLTANVRSGGECLRTIIRAAIELGEEPQIVGNIDDYIERSVDALLRPGDRQMRLADGRWIEARTRETSSGGCLIAFSDVTGAKRAEEELRALNQRLEQLAHTDGLTGLWNRRAFDEAIEKSVSTATVAGHGPSLLMIDVDRFKAYNDTYGHPAGDTCLKSVADCISAMMHSFSGSVVARYGGEEIAVIIPNTSSAAAMSTAKLIGSQVRSLQLPHTGSEKGIVTISIGVANLSDGNMRSRGELLRAADEALYNAKAAGRDCSRAVIRAQASMHV